MNHCGSGHINPQKQFSKPPHPHDSKITEMDATPAQHRDRTRHHSRHRQDVHRTQTRAPRNHRNRKKDARDRGRYCSRHTKQ